MRNVLVTRAQAILYTLIFYQVVLIAIGFWASRRTRNTSEFFLAGRGLGAWVASLSASASSSSAWTLLGVSGAAYAWGLSALWLFPATLLGFVINWTWVAPRLRQISVSEASLTLTEVIAGDSQDPLYRIIVRVAAVMILFSFVFYIAAQFQAAGGAFATTFGLSTNTSVLIGAAVILLYTLLGGFWAVSVTDALQGLLMVCVAVFLPWMALAAVGGVGVLAAGLEASGPAAEMSLTGEFEGVMGLAFVLGTLGIGLGYPGQPHVVNRFMALKDGQALARGRFIAIGWAVAVYAGMLLLGLCARVLFPVADAEQVLFVVANELLSPVVAGVVVAAVLSATMSTADSQLLVAASAGSYDWKLPDRGHGSLILPRAVVVVVSILACLITLYAPAAIFSRVLFAWHALGSAFGPLLILKLCGVRVRSSAILLSMGLGFGLTVLFHLLPNTPGDFLERVVPLLVAFSVAWLGRCKATITGSS